MKLLYKLIMFVGVVGIMSSCGDPEDTMTSDALEGGAIVKLDGSSSGKALGNPLPGGGVLFTDVEFSMTALLSNGGYNVVSYDIVKSFNGGAQIVVANSATLPVSVDYTTIDEFVNGLGVAVADLELGDSFTFSVIQNLPDGRRLQAAPGDGDMEIIINCASALAGSYDLTAVVTGAYTTGTFVFPGEVITEIAPGEYLTTSTAYWGAGVLSPPAVYDGYVFLDNCGVLTVKAQDLGGYYANEVEGEGTVDPVTGDIYMAYTVCFGGNCRIMESDYIKL